MSLGRYGMLTLLCSSLTLLFIQSTAISQDGRILLQVKNVDWIDTHNNLSDWNSYDQNPCHWTGIECNNLNSVVTVNLTGASISGNLTSTLCNLGNLTILSLGENNFGGPFPHGLLECKRLQVLDLSSNKLSGNIPTRLMSLSKLQQLYLYKNKFSGRIPPNISDLKMLSVLDLSANRLTGEIPEEFSTLTRLRSLVLSQNRLTGHIPIRMGELPNLTYIEIYDNSLTGMLPPSLGAYSNISFLDVSGNKLEGPLPEAVCRGNALNALVIFSNNFNGSLPSSLEDCSSLQYARFENNQLRGEIPFGLWSSPNLIWLFLSNNKFQGQIPFAIGKAKNLSILDVSSNNFCCSIPAEVGQLRNLQKFYASNNKFSGHIPDVAGLSSITNLHLHYNMLSGEIPKDVAAMKRLVDLNLAHNQLTGEIPGSLGALQSLTSLDLSDNQLRGKIPSDLGSLKFYVFNISHNRLSGLIPGALDISAYKEGLANNQGLCGGQYLGLRPCSNSDEDKFVFRHLAIIVLTPLLVAALAFCLVLFCCLRYSRLRKQIDALSWKLTPFHSSLGFDERYIFQNMKENNLIGSGGSAKVYKVTLRNQEMVAVKKIQNTVESLRRRRKVEQENLEVEVDTLGLIRHRNILNLLCCIASEEADFKLLVYDYMPNGNLYDHLHHVQSPEMVLNWPIRYQIAVGASRGLSYMHHACSPPILHRDVKSSNILLDSDFQPKIADFGLCRRLQNLRDSYAISGYVGSHGYIAPEYASSLKVGSKSDVYSFGVVLLELVSGKRATGELEYGEGVDIVVWIRSTLCREGGEGKVLDGRVTSSSECVEQMLKVLRVGLVCTRRSPEERPSMGAVVEMVGMCDQHQERVGCPFGDASPGSPDGEIEQDGILD